MKTIFDGVVFSHYGQAYIHLKDTFNYADDVRKGQVNGLLGAAQPTTLFLTFGLHTGNVRLAVKVANVQPAVDDSWEEIVEASFTLSGSKILGLSDWNGEIWQPVPIEPGTYRVRYSARRFGEAEEVPESENAVDPIEHYEVILWRAPLQADRVLKVTRPAAQYWHDVAQGKVR
jgi:hypothetical protein